MHYAHPYLGGIFSEGEISSKKKYLVNTAAISRNISFGFNFVFFTLTTGYLVAKCKRYLIMLW